MADKSEKFSDNISYDCLKIRRKNRENCMFPFANISLITALGGLLLLLDNEKVAFHAVFGVFGMAFSNFGGFFAHFYPHSASTNP